MDWPERWNHVKKLLERSGPFCHPDFEPGDQSSQEAFACSVPDVYAVFDFMQNTCKILVIGAGGLGCELLKDLALLGFRHIDVIDMDTIDISNLNRQFLFRRKDVGKSKAEVAAAFVNQRVPGCNLTAHYCKIQDYGEDFYRSFHVVVCGLDSIVARRWINGMLVNLLVYEDGELDQSSVIPMIDGGTEGFKGNARVILPGMTACVECTLDLYPPQLNFPLCTIAHTPRLPEHCVEYVRILQWPQDKPFGADVAIDGDDPRHVQWILHKSMDRAQQYNIQGVNYRLAQGVIKRIIPAVASTNAVIAAVCATEVFKIATSCSLPLNNFMNFSDTDGVYTYTFEAERKEDCLACSQIPQSLTFGEETKLRDVIQHLTDSNQYQFRSPGLTTMIDGKNKTLYMSSVKSIEERTRDNLKLTLKELGLVDGQELNVADQTSPNTVVFRLQLHSNMDDS